MQIEVRSDNEARITGYVNATEKLSRPVITPHGKVIEVIEPRAFGEAIAAGWDSITLNVDDETIQKRIAAWKQPPLKVKSGYLVKYCKTVSSAASGAVTTSYAEGAFDR